MSHCRRLYRFTFAGRIFIGITIFVFIATIQSQTNLLFFVLGLLLGLLILTGALAAILHLPFIVNDVMRRYLTGTADPATLEFLPGSLCRLLDAVCVLLDPLGSIMLRHARVVRRLEDHALARQPAIMQYELTNPKRRWPMFAVSITERYATAELREIPTALALHVAPGETVTLLAQLTPRRRGLLHLRFVQLTSAFPFGFVARSVLIPVPAAITVYPRVANVSREISLRCREHLASGSMTSDIRGGQDEFYGLREYRPGDNVKAIHWRRTAHTGEPVIREMTNNAPPQMIIALNLRPFRDLPRTTPAERTAALDVAERAIELAASVLCYGFLENFAVGLSLVGGDDSLAPLVQPRSGRDHRAHLLAVLAAIDVPTLAAAPTRPPLLRGKSRAEWVVITLDDRDSAADALPPGATRTILALNHPDADKWLTFVPAALEAPVTTPTA